MCLDQTHPVLPVMLLLTAEALAPFSVWQPEPGLTKFCSLPSSESMSILPLHAEALVYQHLVCQ